MTKEYERSLLGGLIEDSTALAECFPQMRDEMFADADNRLLWQAIKTNYQGGVDISDRIELARAMQRMRPNKSLQDCFAIISDAGNISLKNTGEICSLAANLVNDYQKQALAGMLLNLQAEASNPTTQASEIMSKAAAALQDISKSIGGDKVYTLGDALQSLYSQIAERATGRITGVPTGFRLLDGCGGFHGGDLVIIGAETSQGKTSLALSFTLAALTNGYPVAFYSMEMQKEQLATRLLSMSAKIPSSAILYGTTAGRQSVATDRAAETLRQLPMYIDESSTSDPDKIISSIRRLHTRNRIQVAVIDYLQILNSVGRRRDMTDEQLLASIARRLKNIAKELNIVVIALSQLNRDSSTPAPNLSRLRASGQIAEAADMVILVYRPEAVMNGRDNTFLGQYKNRETHNAAEIIVAKNRNGALMDFLCGFNPECTAFFDADIPERITAVPTDPDRPF